MLPWDCLKHKILNIMQKIVKNMVINFFIAKKQGFTIIQRMKKKQKLKMKTNMKLMDLQWRKKNLETFKVLMLKIYDSKIFN